MNDLMLIKNVLYALKECDVPIFILKSDIDASLKDGDTAAGVNIRSCISFKGKYYAYYQVKQKQDGEPICEADNGDSGQ